SELMRLLLHPDTTSVEPIPMEEIVPPDDWPEIIVHREGWPEVRLPFSSSKRKDTDFNLAAGDRVKFSLSEAVGKSTPLSPEAHIHVIGKDSLFSRRFGM